MENENTTGIFPSQTSSSPMSCETSSSATDMHGQFTSDFKDSYPCKKLTASGLRAIEEIPHQFRHIFSMYPSFNAFQSKVMDEILYCERPVVISAPTGSGKTVLFELAIVSLLIKISDLKYNGNFLIVYVAPIKALCTERLKDWQYKFSSLGLRCQEVTGDSDPNLTASLSTINIVLTTPEKWDSLTRTWKDKKLVQTIKLFLLDEIHLLNDGQRGPVLEAVVSRMKTIHETAKFSEHHETEETISNLPIAIRFIAVSATIPNIEDVASWLGDISNPAQYFSLGEEYRPVKLHKLVMGYHCPQHFSQFRFEMQLSYKLRQLLLQYSEGKPSLVFCSTRKGVLQTADILMKQVTFHFNDEQRRKLTMAMDHIKENAIKKCLAAGVGCHHAGMNINDRHIIEDLFRSGGLPVLITTSTLAMGVNLPAHLVIVKSTQQYTSSGYQEYSSNQILQMIGRAGRPQYDTHATAIIMTREDKTLKYEKLVTGTDILESNLHRHLAEHLNAEVVLSTITEKAVAINWIRSTFLYVRALRNPTYYGISAHLSKKGIEDKLQEMCLVEMNALANAQLLKMDVMDIWSTETGKLMAQHYMSFETMKIFTKINGKESIPEMLNIVTSCQEFTDCKLRVNEKRSLNFLNKSIRFPIKSLIKTSQMKINCLIQAMFGGLVIQEPSLQQEAVQIVRIGIRITKCLTRFLSMQDKYQSLLSATTLCKCFQSNLWEDSKFVSRQLAGIGAVLSQLLVSAGKTSFKSIAESNPRDLERIINRAPPMGNRLQNAALHMPQYSLQVTEVVEKSCSKINISVKLDNYDYMRSFSAPGFDHNLVIIAGNSNNKLLLYKKFQDMLLINNEGLYTWLIEITNTETPKIFIHLISENWVGMDVNTIVTPKSSSLNEVLVRNQPVKNQSKIIHHNSTSKQSVNTHINIEKNKEKKTSQKSILVQLQKSMNFIKTSDKKLTLNVQKKKLQIDLHKYLFKPKEKMTVISKPKEIQEMPTQYPTTESFITKSPDPFKESYSQTFTQNQNPQSTSSLSHEFLQSSCTNCECEEPSNCEEVARQSFSHSYENQNPTLKSLNELESHLSTTVNEISVRRHKNGEEESTIIAIDKDDNTVPSSLGHSFHSNTHSFTTKKKIKKMAKTSHNTKHIKINISDIAKQTSDILPKGSNDKPHIVAEKNKEFFYTQQRDVKGKDVDQLPQRSCCTTANINKHESVDKDTYSKYYPIFVKADHNKENTNKQDSLYSGEKQVSNTERTVKLNKPTMPTEIKVTFNLGIEELLETEIQEITCAKSTLHIPKFSLPFKPKHLDTTNPVSKLLYGNIHTLDNKFGEKNHCESYAKQPLPFSGISPKRTFVQDDLLWAMKGHATFERSTLSPNDIQDTPNLFPIPSPTHNQHQKCTLDAIEFLQNSDQTHDLMQEKVYNKQTKYTKAHNLHENLKMAHLNSDSQFTNKKSKYSVFDLFSD